MSSLYQDLWTAERSRLLRELQEGSAITVSAAEPEHAVRVVTETIEQSESEVLAMPIDFARLGDASSVATEMVRTLASCIAGERTVSLWPPRERTAAQTGDLLEARRLLGDTFERLYGRKEVSDSQTAVIVVEALAAWAEQEGRRPYLVLIGAERSLLTPRLGELLWAIRGTAQRLRGLGVIFCGGPGVTDLTTYPKAAFYGWGVEIALGFPDRKILERVAFSRLAQIVPAETASVLASDIVERSQATLSTTEQLIDILLRQIVERRIPDAGLAWAELCERQAPACRVLASALQGLHTLAVPTAAAIARGERPYSGTQKQKQSSKIARAIAALRIAGVLDRELPNTWRLVDPVFSEWLRASSPAHRIER